jgi:hypothetical protein
MYAGVDSLARCLDRFDVQHVRPQINTDYTDKKRRQQN